MLIKMQIYENLGYTKIICMAFTSLARTKHYNGNVVLRK